MNGLGPFAKPKKLAKLGKYMPAEKTISQDSAKI
jgi:hypothetical protein